ncbi:hypothetical protein EGY07_09840 [Chryseobacterium indologenes]|uniref:Uncharacterized protein n=2 Tax=Chryseobacterium indologenes TaxID=253 RepID=A0AAD0YT51_CHRID|nr:hypothetical protein EGY07_09840 [Chryseobacterium indologenes]AZB16747.1 hypothetical protein EG352_02645 [Chryseobacterium indologenes]
MKFNNLNLSTKEIVNIVKYSTIGILIPMFIIGFIFNALGWTSSTLNEEKVTGLKSLMVFVITYPLYIIMFFIIQFVYIYIGLKIYNFIVDFFKR